MKEHRDTYFIPTLTTEAGRCLTVENWQDVGISMAAYDLTALLMKPGFELLSALPDLATYVGWQGDVVLNATLPDISKDEVYTLRSEYDGSRSRYSQADILMLIGQLKPQMVILPDGIDGWQSLSDTILPLFSPANLPKQAERSFGVYFSYDATASFSTLKQRIQRCEGLPCYVGGELTLALMQELADLGVQYLSSDVPARDASEGWVYSQGEVISLTDNAYRMDFSVIDEQCPCPTCKQQLTRAYLHHLLAHTPLLCQRFLIQHNVYHSSFTPAINTDIM